MSDSTHAVAAALDAAGSDPRVRDRYVRLVDDGTAPVVLVGVVHDHPASVHRARAVVEAVAPGTVAVELPDLLVPAVEGADAGGEMAAAADAAPGSVVGIDVPGRGSVRSLVAELRESAPAPRTVLRALVDAGRIGAHALLGRLSGLGVPRTPPVADLETSHEYDLPRGATPAAQANHERDHLRRSTTLLRSFEPPAATTLLDSVRERAMVRRLRALRQDGPVVAVVGYGHLDAVEAALKNRSE